MLLAEQIKTIAAGLEPLNENFIYVGGAVVECYVTSNVAEQPRPTDDIDVVLELAHYGKYVHLQERLIHAGFNPDSDSKVICRYKYKGITVDIMPDEPRILGFSNKWYKDGIRNSISYKVDDALSIKIFSSPFFIASKIEAYYTRGAQDKRFSTDFEDIMYIFENRKEAFDEIVASDKNVKTCIKEFAQGLLLAKDTDEAIGAVMGYSPLPERIDFVKNVLNKLSTLG
jgi:predicted nucleotidyltransferase